jgi:hypothetical protein
MLKVLVLTTVLVSTSVFAVFPKIEIKGLTGSYSDMEGVASASSASYQFEPVKIKHSAITLDLSRSTREVNINDGTTSVDINVNLAFLDVLKSFDFHDTNVASNLKTFEIDSGVFNINIDKKEIFIKDLYLFSDLQNKPEVNDETSILDGFIMNAELKSRSIDFKSIAVKEFLKELMRENPMLAEELEKELGKRIRIPLIIRNTHVSVKDGVFKVFAKIDSWINAKFILNGAANYNKKTSMLELQINKVKIGIFKVTKTLLKLLKKQNLGNVKVVGNKILIPISKSLRTNAN